MLVPRLNIREIPMFPSNKIGTKYESSDNSRTIKQRVTAITT